LRHLDLFTFDDMNKLVNRTPFERFDKVFFLSPKTLRFLCTNETDGDFGSVSIYQSKQ
jgi:hypothetical protein